MFVRLMVCLMLGVFSSTVRGADERGAASKKLAWGNINGQVIFEGELGDPRLQKFFEDLPLTRPLTQRNAPPGVDPIIRKRIPNEKLIIDAKSKGVKNALVYLKTRPEHVYPQSPKQPPAPVQLKLADATFTPRAFALQVGQTLVMTADEENGEATNFTPTFTQNENFNVLVAAFGPAFKWAPTKSEQIPSSIQSSIFPTARAFCIVKDHPYIAITDQKGRFEIKNLPVGTHQFIVWHETVGYIAKNVIIKIKPNETKHLKPYAITVKQLLR